MSKTIGKVYLVGSGPGDPKLITVRGRELIEKAQVILYDCLAPAELLKLAPKDCEKINVGKSAGKHTLPQNDINELLCKKALGGKIVVRLKGGDPFVFGRGGEEILALKEKNIPFEVVPGITAAIAAPAYCGIPVTHRDFTQTMTLVTGHEVADKEASKIPWDALAKLGGTIAFYMGVKNLRRNLDKLISHGMKKNTPVAFIRWGTTPAQKVFTGTIADIDQKIPVEELKPPAMILVGEVAALRDSMKWIEDRPLFGKRILVTRAREQASEMVTQLNDLGAFCVELPTIKISPPKDYHDLDRAIKNLEKYNWIIFTSVNGVESFFARLETAQKGSRELKGIQIGSIGPATSKRLSAFGIKADFEPKKYQTAGILNDLKKGFNLKGKKVLLPRADIAPKELQGGLEKLGANVVNVTAYRTLSIDDDNPEVREMIKNDGIDCLSFTSSSTVKNFFKWFGPEEFKSLGKKPVISSIGPVTTAALKELGLKPQFEAQESTIPSLVSGIKEFYEKRR